ncbi:MAG: DUF2141 domain-containing protein [Crocinitomix sp.]|nr:DUF2141 domain-containing protein [Crocinitomix sp.]
MNKALIAISGVILGLTLWSFQSDNETELDNCKIMVHVDGLRNSTGNVQFTLYNKEGSIPDEHYENYYRQKDGVIQDGEAKVIFENIPKGNYALNILHDEDMNGKIKKGWILPTEGIGFTNYSSIGLGNRPNFEDASFPVDTNCYKKVKIIYM